MTQAMGTYGQLLCDFETTFGQLPATPNSVKLPFNSAKIKSKQNFIEAKTITGRRDPSEPGRGNIDVSGSVVVPMDEVAIGYWLKGMFGTPTTTGTSDPYIHDFKFSNTQPSLVLEQGFTDIGVYELFNGVKINKFTMSLGGDGELTATIEVIGAKETIGGTSFDTTPTSITLVRFNNFQASIKEGGTSIATCTAVDLNISFGLTGDTYTIGGSGFRTAINEGIAQITGTVKAFFENQTLLNKAINGTKSSLELALINGNHSLTFLLPEVIYERNSPGIEGSQGILIELPYRAFYASNLENTAIKATLNNSCASY